MATASGSVEELAAAIAANAKRSDRESDSGARSELAADSTREAQACLTLQPDSAACLYGSALALGLEAQAHPTRAAELLKQMLDSLARAESADAAYDQAGPARVRALVLIRAPGWPLGPGDTDEGLNAARRAVSLRPDYPPNVLALAEAMSRTGNAGGARDTYTRAREAAQAWPASADRDDWLRQADEALRHR
ncbi:MAG TPA: tetratricopeptide repeat protein [Steroidobacteraceae bacterium]|nr:tetratricopeptide repeat protein [Steroidobacteraceae bacterium]